MFEDILIALIVAASFAIGQALYFGTKEEIEWVKKRYQFKSPSKKFVPFLAGILGAIQAFASGTQNFEIISLISMIAGIAFGSFAISDSNKTMAIKYTAETILVFLILFAVVYLAKNFVV